MAEDVGLRVLKTLAVLMALLFALGVIITTAGTFFFGSSKIRPLFGMTENGPPTKRPDGGY